MEIEPAMRPPRLSQAIPWRASAALSVALFLLLSAVPLDAGCFEATAEISQGLCKSGYKIKVCATNQTAANAYVSQSHGVIVKANCKKALKILCGDIGGGKVTSDLETVCCSVGNQCETDAHCGSIVDPTAVPMCCQYCEEMYNDACMAVQPVNAGFSSIIQLYDTFHAAQIMRKCSAKEGMGGINHQCVPQREDGKPCLSAPEVPKRRSAERTVERRLERYGSASEFHGARRSGAPSVGWGAGGGLLAASVVTVAQVVRAWCLD